MTTNPRLTQAPATLPSRLDNLFVGRAPNEEYTQTRREIEESGKRLQRALTPRSRRYARFTPRERDILEQLYRGLMPIEIAPKLGISRSTVAKHLENLRHKYRAGNVVGVMRAVEHEAAALGDTDLLDQFARWQREAYEAMRAAQAAEEAR